MTRASSIGALGLAAAALLLVITAAPAAAQGPAPAQVVLPTDRTVLPIPEPKYPHSTEFDAAQGHAAAAVRGQGAGKAPRTC